MARHGRGGTPGQDSPVPAAAPGRLSACSPAAGQAGFPGYASVRWARRRAGGQRAWRGQAVAARPRSAEPGDLAAQDRDLLAGDQDPGILWPVTAAQQQQPASDPGRRSGTRAGSAQPAIVPHRSQQDKPPVTSSAQSSGAVQAPGSPFGATTVDAVSQQAPTLHLTAWAGSRRSASLGKIIIRNVVSLATRPHLQMISKGVWSGHWFARGESYEVLVRQ